MTLQDVVVDNANLSQHLAISEITADRECEPSAERCIQYWTIYVEPHQCTLDGVFTATMYSMCHVVNCAHPSPDTTDIVMTISSDDFCGYVHVSYWIMLLYC